MRRLLVVLCLLGITLPGILASPAPVAAATTFLVRGSVEQVSTTGHAPGTAIRLLDSAGSQVDSGMADSAGSLLFRKVTPGVGYQVAGAGGVVVGGIAVTAPDDDPPDSFYTGNVAAHPLAAGYGYITTRDGTTLSANVTFPYDGSTGPWPVVINYSGYDPSQPGPPPQESLMYAAQGYVVVGVNMRGTGCSGGAFEFMETLQSTDGYDVVETLAHEPWANGDVGLVGISYSGYSQLYVAATRPPHLDAITPLSPYSDTYSGILYPGGILNNGFAYEWATDRENAAKPLASGWARNRVAGGDTVCADNQALRLQSKPLLERIRSTPFADHEFDYLNTETFVNRIQVPTFLSAQWQDEQTGGSAANLIPLFDPSTKVYANFTNGTHVEPMAPSEAYEAMVFVDLYVGHRVPHISPLVTAVMPGALADLFHASPQVSDFALPVSDWGQYGTYQAALAHYESQPRVRIRWENGSVPGKEGLPIAPVLTRYANWPIDGTIDQKLYFQPDGALGAAPSGVPDSAARSSSSYVYDPTTKRSRTSDQGTDSQWAPHPDVHWNTLSEGNSLSFLSDPYTSNVAYAGEGSADLWIRSSAPDTDVEVTLTEVRPDGQEMYIQSGWLRASHRKEDPARSTELVPYQDHQAVDAAPLPAGQFSLARVEIFPFAHVVRAGSRLRVNIEAPGGNQPFWAFQDLPGTSVNDIGHSVGMASRVVLPELPTSASPAVPAALPPCTLAGVSTQSVSNRNQPCRPYSPARVATAVTAAKAGGNGLTVQWDPPGGAAPSGYRVVASLGTGAPAGAVAPDPVEVPGSVEAAAFPEAPSSVPLEFRVIARYGSANAPASDASLPMAAGSTLPAAFDSWSAFVRQQLTDFTGIVPPARVDTDVARLEAGLTPEAYIDALRHEDQVASVIDPLVRLYFAFYQRTPTPQELGGWAGLYRAGEPLDVIAQQFATSSEFVRTHGSLSNREFASLVFLDTGTTSSPGLLDFATALLDLGYVNRGQVMASQTESAAFVSLVAPYVDAAVIPLAMLHVAPDAPELVANVGRLAAGTPLTALIAEVLDSPEYTARIEAG